AGVVAEQAEAESPLALEGAVAGAGATAVPAEQGHHVALEIDFRERAAAGHPHRLGPGRAGEQPQGRGEQRGRPAGGAQRHISSSAKGWAGPVGLGAGRDWRIALARARSGGAVILMFDGDPSTTWTLCPAASTSWASSVTSGPSRARS